jgi:hypothetical protein
MVLPARNPVYSLTAPSAKGGVYGSKIGLVWWIIGMIMAAGCFTFLYQSFVGKVDVDANRQGSGRPRKHLKVQFCCRDEIGYPARRQ